MIKDPVCGMDCDPKTSDKVEYQGQDYYFCAPGCKEEFEKNPERYIRLQTGQIGKRGETREGGYR